jgi:hypothetical protein
MREYCTSGSAEGPGDDPGATRLGPLLSGFCGSNRFRPDNSGGRCFILAHFCPGICPSAYCVSFSSNRSGWITLGGLMQNMAVHRTLWLALWLAECCDTAGGEWVEGVFSRRP